MKIAKIRFLLFAIVLFTACKPDGASPTTDTTDTLEVASDNYKSQPSMATGNALIMEISKKLSDSNLSDADRNKYLEKGLQISKEQNIVARQGSFLFPYIKNNMDKPDIQNKIYDLAELMRELKKNAAANVLYKGLKDKFPNFKSAEEISAKMSTHVANVDDYVMDLGKVIFENPDENGVNRNAALQYVDACEAYAIVYQDSTAAEYLFKAAKIAESIRTFPKSLSLYDWVIDKYPNHVKAPTAMFLKGFIIENNLGNDSLALISYKEYMARYPNDDLVDDAQFLIDNLGKTDEEILKLIEDKRKEKAGQ